MRLSVGACRHGRRCSVVVIIVINGDDSSSLIELVLLSVKM